MSKKLYWLGPGVYEHVTNEGGKKARKTINIGDPMPAELPEGILKALAAKKKVGAPPAEVMQPGTGEGADLTGKVAELEGQVTDLTAKLEEANKTITELTLKASAGPVPPAPTGKQK